MLGFSTGIIERVKAIARIIAIDRGDEILIEIQLRF